MNMAYFILLVFIVMAFYAFIMDVRTKYDEEVLKQ